MTHANPVTLCGLRRSSFTGFVCFGRNMGLIDNIRAFFGGVVPRGNKVKQDDNVFYDGISNVGLRDRSQGNFYNVIEASLQAWRENPLARRIVNLTTQYVIGEGLTIECDDEKALTVMKDFWNDPLNRMDIRVAEWCDELTRTGNLFVLISSGIDGKSYVRAVPATAIENIETAANDYEQALWFEYREENQLQLEHVDAEKKDSPTLDARMMHFAVNRPLGAKFGEPDLAPVLIWLQRYSGWLEDRARLNHYRNSFLYTVKAKGTSEQQRIERQNQLNSRPLSPGSILVTNEAEEWDVLSAKLESNEAAEDGLALKKQIAAGVGIPMHFLAEPESQSKTSAEAAGGATFRTFEQRQEVFTWIVEQVLRAVLRRRRLVDYNLDAEVEFRVIGADIYELDNTTLATGAATIANVCTQMRKLGYISREEYIRLVYKFAGEDPDPNMILEGGAAQSWNENEYLTFMSAINNNNGDIDPTKYSTTTIDKSVGHYEQGAQKFSQSVVGQILDLCKHSFMQRKAFLKMLNEDEEFKKEFFDAYTREVRRCFGQNRDLQKEDSKSNKGK